VRSRPSAGQRFPLREEVARKKEELKRALEENANSGKDAERAQQEAKNCARSLAVSARSATS
jgi:hypothetical protein